MCLPRSLESPQFASTTSRYKSTFPDANRRIPALFVHSHGHGDVLRPGERRACRRNSGGRICPPYRFGFRQSSRWNSNRTSAGTCNLLFTQGLQDKRVTASISTSKGDWRKAKNVFILGELASIALERNGSKAIRVRVENGPVPSPATLRSVRPLDCLMPGSLQAKIGFPNEEEQRALVPGQALRFSHHRLLCGSTVVP